MNRTYKIDKKLILASSSPRRKKILEDNGYEPIVISSFGEIDIINQEYSRKLVCRCAKEKAKKTYEIYKENLHKEVYNDLNSKITVELGLNTKSMKMKTAINETFGGDVEKYFDFLVKNMILITADTVVANEGIIYGKPKDRNDAIKMLKSLSGKTHIVCTAICVVAYIDEDTEVFVNDKKVFSDISNDDEEEERIVFTTGSEETKVTFRDLTDEEIENYIDNYKPYDKAGSYGIQDNGFSFANKIEGNLDNVIGFPIRRFEELLEQLGIEY